ncbi:ArnT family glycosyltransferase [Metallibacterium scheffleri]|nr:glycosyltransferase family 39 protein [Metallibacterium scheffleri]
MMLNNARIFSETGRYGYFYNEFFYFPSQTDGLIVVLASILFKFFGVGIFTAQLPNLIFNIILLSGIIVTVKQFGAVFWSGGLVAASVILVPGFSEFSAGGYGEIPVLALFLWALIAFRKSLTNSRSDMAFVSGLLLGLAFITKVMALFFITPAISLALFYLYKKKIRLKIIFAAAIGALAVPLIWECFRFVQMGLSGYRQWWSLQIFQILHQSGASTVDHAGAKQIVDRAILHLTLLGGFVSINALNFLLLIIVAVVGYLIFRKRLENIGDRFAFDVIALTCALLFFWWIFLLSSNGAWLRRIEDGLLMLYIFYCTAVVLLFKFWRTHKLIMRTFVAIVLVTALVSLSDFYNNYIGGLPRIQSQTHAVLRGARLLNSLPANSHIFGVGWWQSPQLSLFSNRSFYNYQHWTIKKLQDLHHAYFVTDGYAQALGANELNFVLDSSVHSVLMQSSAVSIYKINQFLDYPHLEIPLDEVSTLPSALSQHTFNFNFSRGIYHDFWSRPQSEVVLGRSDESSMNVKIVVPPAVIKSNRVPTVFKIVSPGCINYHAVVKSWVNTYQIPIECSAYSVIEPFFVKFSINAHAPFIHQIDADNRLLGFILQSVQLEKWHINNSDTLSRFPNIVVQHLSAEISTLPSVRMRVDWADNRCAAQTGVGTAKFIWQVAQPVKGSTELYVRSPPGPQTLFAAGGQQGSAVTGAWVQAGQEFTLRTHDGRELAIVRMRYTPCQ